MRGGKIACLLVVSLFVGLGLLPVTGSTSVDVEEWTNETQEVAWELSEDNLVGTITIVNEEETEPAAMGDVVLEYTVDGITITVDGFNLAAGSYNIYLGWSSDFTGVFFFRIKDQTDTLWLKCFALIFNGAKIWDKVEFVGNPYAGAQTLTLFALGVGMVGIYFEYLG